MPPDRAVSAEPQDEAIGFVLELGRALHSHGYPAHRLEGVMDRVARHFGLEGQFFSQPTSIFAGFGRQDLQHTYLMRVEPGGIRLEKLAALDAVVSAVLAGRVGAASGRARIEAIEAAPAPYGPALTVLAFGVASGASAVFLGGGVREVAAAAAIGVAVGLLSLASERWPATARVFEPVAACVASALAVSIARFAGPCSVYVATLAGIIVLLPGLTLTTAMTELSTRNLASGTARLSGATMLFIAIAFGVAMGRRIAESLFGVPLGTEPRPLPPGAEAIALVLAPFALSVLLRAPRREVSWVLLVGVLGFAGGRLGARLLSPELGIFVGAFTAGLASNLYARYRDRPAPVTLVPAILLLVPGSVGFRSLVSLLDRQVVLGVEAAFRMVIMLAALVAGLLISGVVAPGRKWEEA